MASGKLMRSRSDRRIAGVCGGLAAYLNIDATLIRVLWVLAVFGAGFGILAYLVLWLMLPEGEPERRSAAVEIAEHRYARGEITVEELQRIKEDLHS